MVHGRELRIMGLVGVLHSTRRRFRAKAVLFERSKMPDRCVVADCSNIVDKLGMVLAVHTIPFFGDLCPEAKKRRKNMGGLHGDKTSSKGYKLRSSLFAALQISSQLFKDRIVIPYPAHNSLSEGQNSSTRIISVVRSLDIQYASMVSSSRYPTGRELSTSR